MNTTYVRMVQRSRIMHIWDGYDKHKESAYLDSYGQFQIVNIRKIDVKKLIDKLNCECCGLSELYPSLHHEILEELSLVSKKYIILLNRYSRILFYTHHARIRIRIPNQNNSVIDLYRYIRRLDQFNNHSFHYSLNSAFFILIEMGYFNSFYITNSLIERYHYWRFLQEYIDYSLNTYSY